MTIRTYSVLTMVCVVASLFLVSVAIAEEGTTGVSTTERPKVRPLQMLKEKITENKQERLEEREEKKAERVEKLEEKKIERVGIKEENKVERAGVKEEKREMKTEVRERVKEKVDGIKSRVNNLLRAQLGAIINRLNSSVRHFETLVERIESRIQKLQDRGFDTVSVDALLRTAVGLVAEAKADVQTIKNLVEGVSDITDTAALKEQLRGAVTEATASVKAAHQSLVDVVKALTRIVSSSVDDDSKGKNVEVETDN